MSASLVGSEMCIRDRPIVALSASAERQGPWTVLRLVTVAVRMQGRPRREPVSYTHLTLPTICSV
eukprot:10927549-Alexandrium_andersonii.AAC.1